MFYIHIRRAFSTSFSARRVSSEKNFSEMLILAMGPSTPTKPVWHSLLKYNSAGITGMGLSGHDHPTLISKAKQMSTN